MNSIINSSIILLSTTIGAFTQVIANTMGSMTSGLAEAIGGKESQEKVDAEFKENLPKFNEKKR